MNYFVTVKTRTVIGISGEPEGRHRTVLHHYLGGQHEMRGPDGHRIITEVCHRWNQSGHDSPPPTRCRADASAATMRRWDRELSTPQLA